MRSNWIGWTVLLCSLMIGLVCGFFMMKLDRVGSAFLASWGGLIVGFVLNQTVLYLLESNITFWCVSFSFAIIAGICSFYWFDHVLINMTAFSGAYMIVRGISFFAGGYPNEFTLVNETIDGVMKDETRWFYLYLVSMLTITAVGSFVQYKIMEKDKSETAAQLEKL